MSEKRRRNRSFKKFKKNSPSNFTKQKPAVMGFPCKGRFKVYSGNLAVTSLCDPLWKLIRAYTHEVEEDSGKLWLSYVTSMAFVHRLVSCNPCKAYDPEDYLKYAALHIQLPGCLCEYIEAVGEITIANGPTILPWVDDPDKLYSSPGFISPIEILKQANRPVPNNPWGIDTDWIIEWNDFIYKFESYMDIRIPDYKKPGSLTQLVTATGSSFGLTPVSMYNMSMDMLNRGAIYRFRDWDHQNEWPGDTLVFMSQLFCGRSFQDPIMEWMVIAKKSIL